MKGNPACHPYTLFVAGLTPLYRTALLKSASIKIPILGYSAEADLQACKAAMGALSVMSHDHADVVRQRVYQDLVSKLFGNDHEEVRELKLFKTNEALRFGTDPKPDGSASSHVAGPLSSNTIGYDEDPIEHMSVHEDLRNLVHEAFSPNFDWHLPDDSSGSRMR